jgi:hypothetical protein
MLKSYMFTFPRFFRNKLEIHFEKKRQTNINSVTKSKK